LSALQIEFSNVLRSHDVSKPSFNTHWSFVWIVWFVSGWISDFINRFFRAYDCSRWRALINDRNCDFHYKKFVVDGLIETRLDHWWNDKMDSLDSSDTIMKMKLCSQNRTMMVQTLQEKKLNRDRIFCRTI